MDGLDGLLDQIREYGSGVTVVELLHNLEAQGIDVDGEFEVYWPYEPVVIWSGLSEKAATALSGLLSHEEVSFMPTPALTYAMDGTVLNMPVASVKALARRYKYKTRRWLPISFGERRK